jgi:DUF438 domain-containing protein
MTCFVSIEQPSDFVTMLDEQIEETEEIKVDETIVEEFIHTYEHQAQTTTTSLEEEINKEEEILCNDTYDEYNEAEYWDAVDYDSNDRYYYEDRYDSYDGYDGYDN